MKSNLLFRCFIFSTLSLSLCFSSCLSDEEDKPVWSEVVNLYISAETGEYTPWDSDKEFEGMKIRENESEDWQVVHFESVEGFTYEKGYKYYLKTEKIHLGKPLQDASDIKYKLIDILSKE